MKQFPKLNIYDNTLSIYDRDVQDKLISDIEKQGANERAIFDVFEDIISLHQDRRLIQCGMWSRSKLNPASRFEVPDPRKADGVPIFARPSISDAKENHKLHTAFDKKIVTNKAAYIAGQSPAGS